MTIRLSPAGGRLAAAALILLLAPVARTQGQPRPEDKAARIDALLEAAHRFRLFNGAALVAENGRVIYKKGFGLANMEWSAANAPDTKFRIGSITKPFTAALVMQLVAEGKLRLDGTVAEYLPDYRKDTGEKVTIRQLLSHTSGIPDYTARPRFAEDVSRNPFAVAEFVKQYASGDLEFAPGTQMSYSNSGYFLLGAIAERVTGKSYEQLMQERIFGPLGMTNSGYDRPAPVLPKRACGYVKTVAGYENAAYLDTSIPYAAGALYSTVEDLFLFDQALYADKLIPKAARDLMFTPVMSDYALGWGVATIKLDKSIEKRVTAHDGGINGFNGVIWRLVDDRNLIVLLDNTSQGRSLGPLRFAITKILYGLPYETPKQPVAEILLETVAKQGVAAAVGQYRELKAGRAGEFDFSEGELNRLGLYLLGQRRDADAIEIFKLNVEAYPKAFNAYYNLGEAYRASGNKELAIANYRKALELNPEDWRAANKLKLLTGGPPK